MSRLRGGCTSPKAPRTLPSSRTYTRRSREQTTLASLCAPAEEQLLPTSLRKLSLGSGKPCPPTRQPAPPSSPEASQARGEGWPGKPGPAGGREDPGFPLPRPAQPDPRRRGLNLPSPGRAGRCRPRRPGTDPR